MSIGQFFSGPAAGADMGAARALLPRARAALADRRGAGTGQMLFWTGAFVVMLALIADLSMLYTTNASMWDTARDTARRMAIGSLSAADAPAHAARSVALGDASAYTVTAVDGDEVVVTITTPVSSASVVGLYAAAVPGELTARVTMMKEPK